MVSINNISILHYNKDYQPTSDQINHNSLSQFPHSYILKLGKKKKKKTKKEQICMQAVPK